jgi:hypothetical protein
MMIHDYVHDGVGSILIAFYIGMVITFTLSGTC